MTPDVPGPYALVLLALAAYRVWRLLAEDTILDRPRRAVLRLGDWEDGQAAPESYRAHWAEFLVCPWCLGFWVGLGWWAFWQAWPGWALWAAVPFVISAAVGITNGLVGYLTED